MQKAHIIVDLGFGDNGKGMTTDFLCSQYLDSVVVRFNGGHQATHTVIRGGVKHSFSSFGSGSLLGRPSYFSEHCCFYPPSIEGEYKDLLSKGISPRLTIHPLAKVTTPYDIAYNRLQESRLKHGSTGVGIGATFKRNEGQYKLHAVDLTYIDLLEQKLDGIQNYYESILKGCTSDEIEYYYAIVTEETMFFYKSLEDKHFRIQGYEYLQYFQKIVFEGAQGVMLDMDFGVFPNVTYSNCTSKNALEICKLLEINDVNIHYVTRCYQTRHGNGWISNENSVELINTQEEINVTGNWQGIFRVAEVDTKLLNYAIQCDNVYSFKCKKHLHVTCLDQRPGFNFPYEEMNLKLYTIREQNSPSAEAKSRTLGWDYPYKTWH